jgi:hypothetical protein
MTTITKQNAYQDVDLEASPSRRDVIRRLASLGLIAVSGTILAPVAADARGKKQGKHQGSGRGGRQNTEPSAEPGAAGRGGKKGGKKGRRGDGNSNGGNGDGGHSRLEITDLPDPRVSATLTIGRRSGDNYPVTVTGSISFDHELVALMKNGRQFGLVCELWTLEDNAYSTRIDSSMALVSGTAIFTATSGRSFTFSEMVGRSQLNEDSRSCFLGICTGNDEDDIGARLYLKSRRTSSASSKWQPVKLSNGRFDYRTNVIERAL